MTDLPEPTELVICRRCGQLVGPWRGADGQLCFVEDCADGRITQGTRNHVPDYEGIRGWEQLAAACDRHQLCACCGAVWIRDRSRWSIWFCELGCKDRVVALNSAAGRVVIPIGRHSIVNRSSVKPGSVDVEEQVARFVDTMRTVAGVRPKLDLWLGTRARTNLEMVGMPLDRDVPIRDYLAVVESLDVDRELSFVGMCNFIGARSEQDG